MMTDSHHNPCPTCGSSDAMSVYADGGTHCFSCKTTTRGNGEATVSPIRTDMVTNLEFPPLVKRGLTADTCRRYGYGVATYNGQTVQVAPYFDDKGALVAQKLRGRDKQFRIVGNGKDLPLFGIQLARRNGKMIVITEGEIDALSCSQALGNTWPCVSLPGGASNLKPLRDALEFLETYEKVVLAFDNDEPGQAALVEALELFSPGKAHVVSFGEAKDANEMLLKVGQQALRSAIWEAKQWRPDGIVSLADMHDEIAAPLELGTPYPWEGLNKLTFGFRPGELITWTAGTGVGKTAIISELEYNLLVVAKQTIGIIHLEEGCVRTGRRLVGIQMNKPIHLPDTQYEQHEFEDAFNLTLGTGRAYAYNHFGSLDSEVLLNRVRYLVRAHGCTTVFLDHVSMVVSGADLDADERRLLDRTMTMLKSLTEETGVTIHVISHLRRPPGAGSHEEGRHVSLSHLRGTQAIAQLSDAVIAAERNQQAEDQIERDTTTLRVLKNRYAGLTGPACKLVYDRDTGRLHDTDVTQAMATEDF
jgi:twinkle protein